MREAFRIGRLFGIDIGIDWSWGLIFLLMAWNLTATFLIWHPIWSFGMSFIVAVIAAILFFASVVAHELAHALVAGSFGVHVHEIRLFLFGGVASLDREPPSPAAEFWTAIVGPLVSFALGFLFVLIASFMVPTTVDLADPWDTLAHLGPIATLLSWLGPINILIGVFNLIPGFPLDGGRILRAALWRLTGNLHKATLTSSLIGKAIGWIFVIMGIAMVFGAWIPFFGRGAVGGIWLAFIGWFLSIAAERSYGALLVQDALHGVRVSTLMRRESRTVPPDTSVRAIASEWFMRSSERAFPVVADGKLLGLVCIADVRKVPEDTWSHTPITAIMTPREQLAVVAPDEDALAALRKFAELDVDQLPVVEREDRFAGMITRSQVARWLELHLGGRSPYALRSTHVEEAGLRHA